MKVLAGISMMIAIIGLSAAECSDIALIAGLAGWLGAFAFGSIAERRAA